MNIFLKKQLIGIMKDDQKMRRGKQWDNKVDENNIRKLKLIIKKHGWPDEKMVGKKGATASWLIAQHADHDIEFQKQCLNLICDLNKKIPKWQIAYLTDRVNVNLGKPQIYGTQFYLTKNKKLTFRPIKNRKELNQRRAEVGLGSFEEYKQNILKK